MIIKLEYCGICGSDIGNIFRHSSKASEKIGHEISGIVSKIGESINDFKIGDRVTVNHHVPCGKCHYCSHGNDTMCKMFFEGIEPCGLSENFLVTEWVIKNGGIFKIPDELSLREAVLIEPLACCLRAWKKINGKENSSICILGYGAIGILFSIIAKHHNIKSVIIDFDKFRLDFGKRRKLGDYFHQRTHLDNEFFSKFEQKIDLCIVANSDPSCLNDAMRMVRKGGTILFFGEPEAKSFTQMDVHDFYSREIKITTSYSATNQDFLEAIEFISKNKEEFSEIITHSYTLDDAIEAIKKAKDGQNRIKIIVSSNQN